MLPPDPARPNGTDEQLPTELADAYAELQTLLLDRPDLTAFLQQVAALAAAVVVGTSCGITMRREGEVATIATSDDLAIQVDEIQYGSGKGPCLEAMNTERVVTVSDLADDDRWGTYRMHALTFGVRSSLSIPLVVDGRSLGALNLYATTPDRFVGEDVTRAEAFAKQAATALTIIVRSVDKSVLETQLREALVTRSTVYQALGIIMGQQRCTSSEAFAVLRRASQTRNVPLRDIAAQLVETTTGQPPDEPLPFAEPR